MKQEMKISEKYDFYEDGANQQQAVDFPSEDETKIKDKKTEYCKPTLQTVAESEEQTKIDNKNFLDVELERNKIDSGIEQDKNIKRVAEIFDEVQNEPEIKPEIEKIFSNDFSKGKKKSKMKKKKEFLEGEYLKN